MALQRPGIFCLIVLLAVSHASNPANAQDADDTLQYTEKFLTSKIGYQMMHIDENMKAAMSGALKPQTVQSPKKISVSCLNSLAPSPLNWKMWCPDTHATVTHWVDHAGSTHRKMVMQPMPDMTADMAVWFMTPMFPKTLTVNGQSFTKNQLWHPLDHNKKQDFKLAPGKQRKDPISLMSKLDETYRAPAGSSTSRRVYKTDLWVSAQNLADNLPQNRYVLGYDVMGFQVFTMVVEFNDSPDGLVASVEVIIGAAVKGYDPKYPFNGVTPAMAKAANAMLLEPMMAPYRANGDFKAALDAVTRHVVEEFGNLPNFVPEAWNSDERGTLSEELAQFKNNIINITGKPPSKVELKSVVNGNKMFRAPL